MWVLWRSARTVLSIPWRVILVTALVVNPFLSGTAISETILALANRGKRSLLLFVCMGAGLVSLVQAGLMLSKRGGEFEKVQAGFSAAAA